MSNSVRVPAVAGTFYPSRREELWLMIYSMLNEADANNQDAPKALVAPHAGYIFSGGIAAQAWKSVENFAAQYKRLVLVGSAHRAAFEGIAVSDAAYFASPLGTLALDREFIDNIVDAGIAVRDGNAHRYEHSLEVQLPFIQKLLPEVRIVPLLIGRANIEAVVRCLNFCWGDDSTLVVVSTDLSHYLSEMRAVEQDRLTMRKIAFLDPTIADSAACAALPLNALLYLASLHNLEPCHMQYAHSGMQSGDTERVVGYGAVALTRSHSRYALGAIMLKIARAAIQARWCDVGSLLFPRITGLHDLGATFVTLTRNGQLRGCIGRLQASDIVLNDIQRNAVAAAFNDPRFAPLTCDELGGLNIEVSLLSTPEALFVTDEESLVNQLRPGVDGIVLRYRGAQGTFLPQVWQELPEPQQFIKHLKMKAGLSPDFWSEEIQCERYTVEKWKESDYTRWLNE